MEVIVSEYNPQWPHLFLELKSIVWPCVSKYARAIEHVGSTAVEGMSAKPRIDIDVIAEDVEKVRSCIFELSKIGYSHLGDLGIQGREALQATDPIYPHNLYICLEGSDALKNHLVLRDHMRSHPQDLLEYSQLKSDLALKYPNDLDAYCEAKTDFIVGILKQYDFSVDSLDGIDAANR